MAKKTSAKQPASGSKDAKKPARKKIRKFRDKPWDPEDQDRGMDEFKMIQSMIARQESNRLKLRSWGISLISFFTVAYLTPKVVEIPTAVYFGVTVLLTALFFALEIYHAIAEYRLMDRSREVEECLRKRKWGYYGPMIGITLIQRIQFREFSKIAGLRRIHLPYLVMGLGILLTALVKLLGIPLH